MKENTEILTESSESLRNSTERERAFNESREQLLQRLEQQAQFPPTETEKRIGAYKEMLEPQVREALVILVEKGYVTIDSGYSPKEVSKGTQYIGFKKEMINESLLPLIRERVSEGSITPTISSDERSDYLILTPTQFFSLEEWKVIWDSVADVFPEKNEPAPVRERFIDRIGH